MEEACEIKTILCWEMTTFNSNTNMESSTVAHA